MQLGVRLDQGAEQNSTAAEAAPSERRLKAVGTPKSIYTFAAARLIYVFSTSVRRPKNLDVL